MNLKIKLKKDAGVGNDRLKSNNPLEINWILTWKDLSKFISILPLVQCSIILYFYLGPNLTNSLFEVKRLSSSYFICIIVLFNSHNNLIRYFLIILFRNKRSHINLQATLPIKQHTICTILDREFYFRRVELLQNITSKSNSSISKLS